MTDTCCVKCRAKTGYSGTPKSGIIKKNRYALVGK